MLEKSKQPEILKIMLSTIFSACFVMQIKIGALVQGCCVDRNSLLAIIGVFSLLDQHRKGLLLLSTVLGNIDISISYSYASPCVPL